MGYLSNKGSKQNIKPDLLDGDLYKIDINLNDNIDKSDLMGRKSDLGISWWNPLGDGLPSGKRLHNHGKSTNV